MADGQTIIIKRVKKGGGHGHHGGAWKVAYADFVTAMMAFFLMMWLLSSTTEAQKQGISDYFTPVSVSTASGGAGGMLGGQAISSPGAMTSRTAVPSVSLKIEPTQGATKGDAEEEGGASDKPASADEEMEEDARAMTARLEAEAAAEQTGFDDAEKIIREEIRKTPDLKDLENHLLIDKTPEGLRIQVVDRKGRPMFASGSATMKDYMRKLIKLIATTITRLPNQIKITGHTDSVPFKGRKNYSNWELSSERAQASRRVIIEAGFPPNRVTSVSGRAARDPLLPDNTKSPRNRRVSILLLKRHLAEKQASAKTVSQRKKIVKSKPTKPENLRNDWTGPRVR
jgi:chemotaxis protein MotB